MRELSRRLVASRVASDPQAQETILINANLRNSLIQLTGADGFAALLRRSLALASVELPALQGAAMSTDGRLEGIEQLTAHSSTARDEVAVAVTAHMLELLVTLIGEPLTRRLVRQACPDTTTDE